MGLLAANEVVLPQAAAEVLVRRMASSDTTNPLAVYGFLVDASTCRPLQESCISAYHKMPLTLQWIMLLVHFSFQCPLIAWFSYRSSNWCFGLHYGEAFCMLVE
jgi:hypothetical protein